MGDTVRKSLPMVLLTAVIVSGLTLVNSAHFGTVQASAGVIGIITSNTTWTKASSPYDLIGPTAVDKGVTLIIEPGVTVNLGGYYIEVNGTLYARGSSADPIRFNGGRIEFRGSSTSWNEQTGSGSIIENGILSSIVIDINDTSPKINNNSIKGHINGHQGSFIISNNYIVGDGYVAVIVTGLGSPIISNNTVIDNDKQIGIEAGGYSTVISNNTIKGSGGKYGIEGGNYVSDNVVSGFFVGIYTSIDTVERNLVINNTRGIEVGMHASTIRKNTIANNTVGIFSAKGDINFNNIQDNSEYNVQLDLYATGDVNATYNWWGTTDTNAISQKIHDNKNDFNLGTVTFVPFLTEPNPEAIPDPNAPTIPTSTPPTSPPSSSPSPDQNNTSSPSQSDTEAASQAQEAIIGVAIAVAIVVIVAAAFVLGAKAINKTHSRNTLKSQNSAQT
jgi:hypothetical protein